MTDISPRLTQQRLYAIADQLGARDRQIIHTLGLTRLATTKQLERLHFWRGTAASKVRMGQKTLRRLTNLGVLSRFPRQQGGNGGGSTCYYYGLGQAGQRLSARALPRYLATRQLGKLNASHILAVTELYVQCYEGQRLERLSVVLFEPEPTCWRTIPGLGRKRLKPDSYLIVRWQARDSAWFIEMDMATEPPHRIRDKLTTYSRYWVSGREQSDHGTFPLVLFLVPSTERLAQIQEVINQQPTHARPLFRVALQSQALSTLIGGL